jgi:hypothetical protein
MISSVDKAKSGTQDQTKEMIKIFNAENVEPSKFQKETQPQVVTQFNLSLVKLLKHRSV